MNPLIIVAAIFLLNLPFGAWRGTTRKLSPAWFVSIHVPVIIAIILRIASGMGFHVVTFIETVTAFFLGQFGGGWLYRLWKARPRAREAGSAD